MEKHLCIICGRSGSKSIKDKNLIQFNGKSLFRLALEPALKSQIFSRIIISTDYPRHRIGIDGVSTGMTQLVFSTRTKDLCEDSTPIIDVIKNVLTNHGGDEKWIWLLQPTSPFRTVDEFIKIKSVLSTGEWESVISFKPVKEWIDRIYTIKEKQAHRINQCNYKNKQEIRPQVTRSGNYYVTKREHLFEFESFEVKPFYTFMMGGIDPENATDAETRRSRILGCNIDCEEDLEIAKGAVRRGDIVL